jgi:hypothetical protein
MEHIHARQQWKCQMLLITKRIDTVHRATNPCDKNIFLVCLVLCVILDAYWTSLDESIRIFTWHVWCIRRTFNSNEITVNSIEFACWPVLLLCTDLFIYAYYRYELESISSLVYRVTQRSWPDRFVSEQMFDAHQSSRTDHVNIFNDVTRYSSSVDGTTSLNGSWTNLEKYDQRRQVLPVDHLTTNCHVFM